MRRNQPQGQEHWQRRRPSPERSFDDLEGFEAVSLVERRGFGLGVHDNVDTPYRFGHVACDLEDCSQQQLADSTTLSLLVDRETGEAKNRQRVLRQLLSLCFGQILDIDVSGGDGGEAEDMFVIDCDVRSANVVTKLILPGETAKEAVEVDIARLEVRAIVVGMKQANGDGTGRLLTYRFLCQRKAPSLPGSDLPALPYVPA